MIAREQGQEKAKGASENVIYKIEVPANRFDSLEGWQKSSFTNFYAHLLYFLSGMIYCVRKDSLEAYWCSWASELDKH